jgi:signal transduction histidine kinase
MLGRAQAGWRRAHSYTWLLVGLWLAATVAAAGLWRSEVRNEGVRSFQVEAGNVGSEVTTAMRRIDDVTVALRTFIEASPGVGNRSLERWYAGMGAGGRYPGLVGFTYIEAVPAGRVAAFAAALRADPVPGITPPPGPLRIRPAGRRPYYCLIRAGTPSQTALASAVGPGRDLCQVRGAQLFTSTRDSGQLSTVALAERPGARVLVVAVPIYRGRVTPSSLAARRTDVTGWALGEFNVTSVLGSTLAGDSDIAVSLYRRNLVYTRSVRTVVGPASDVARAGRLSPGAPMRQTLSTRADGRWIVTVAKVWSWGILSPDTQGLIVLLAGLLIGVLGLRLQQAKNEALHANAGKTAFLSHVTHELRTPLNSILGFGQLIESDEVSDAQRHWAQEILVSGRHLLDLINELLDIARAESGRLTVSLEPVAVRPILADAVTLVGPQADERGILVNIACEACDSVEADPRRMRQVMLNLLGNAIKYNRPGGEVTVDCRTRGSRLLVLVRDTGAGIPESAMEDLFLPFRRLGAEDQATEGSGLGLALSHRLMELMGGSLRVQSEPGSGSTFIAEFERADSSPDAGGASDEEVVLQ